MATDPALIGWQRLGGSPSAGKSIIQVCTSRHLSESRPPSGKRGRGAQPSSSNTEPVLETAHEDAERDDEHLVDVQGQHRETESPRQGVKRTPLAHGVRYWTRRETLEKQSVCYVKATCGYDYRTSATSSCKEGVPRQRTSRGGRDGSGGIVSQSSRRELCHV